MARLLAVAAVLLTAGAVAAQSLPTWADAPPPPPREEPEDFGFLFVSPTAPSTPTVVPIDGGLGLLLLAGGAYGVRRLRSR